MSNKKNTENRLLNLSDDNKVYLLYIIPLTMILMGIIILVLKDVKTVQAGSYTVSVTSIPETNLDYEFENIPYKNLGEIHSKKLNFEEIAKFRENEYKKEFESSLNKSVKKSRQDNIKVFTNGNYTQNKSVSSDINKLLNISYEYLNVPYVWGGTNPRIGLDCSGFVQLVYKRIGYNLPRVSKDQSRVGKLIIATKLQPGDLLFFDTLSKSGANITIKNLDLENYLESDSYRPQSVSHVGMYIGDVK